MAVVRSIGPRILQLRSPQGASYPLQVRIDLLDGDPKTRKIDPGFLWGSVHVNCGDLNREIVAFADDEIQLMSRLIYLCSSYLDGVKELQKIELYRILPGDSPTSETLFR